MNCTRITAGRIVAGRITVEQHKLGSLTRPTIPMAGMLCWFVAPADFALRSAKAVARDATSEATTAENPPSTERGISGSYRFQYSGSRLRVKTQRDPEASLIVRLRRGEPGDQYEALFIGTRKGIFDLSETLEHADGSPVDDLPNMPVSIISTLPKDQRSDLFAAVDFQPRLAGGYRGLLIAAGVAWLLVPVTVGIVRYLRRPVVVEVAPPPPEPTWGELLEPLVKAAAARPLTADEQGRLELLLLHYWRERSSLAGASMADSIRQLREHAEAGPVVRAVESWLHRSSHTALGDDRGAAASTAEVLKLLDALHTGTEREEPGENHSEDDPPQSSDQRSKQLAGDAS